MKLTAKQKETLDRFKQLESEYGEGNVFIRWINDYWKAMFIIHIKGTDKYDVKLKDEYRVNGRIINSLEEKGMLRCMDKDHNIVENANEAHHKGLMVVGNRIISA